MAKIKWVYCFFGIFFFTTNVQAQVKKQSYNKTITSKKKLPAKPQTIKKLPGVRVKLTTDSGVMIIRLYDKTPLHRDNFIKLVTTHFFDSLLFHRVINGFMIQGGDPLSKNAPSGTMLGNGDIGYTIPAEFDSSLFHKKGALAAARTENPEKASSGCQFYIVQGRVFSDMELDNMEMQTGRKFSAAKRMAYKTVGGTPFLDLNYTVFGEVESGFEVIDKIAAVPGDMANRPLRDIRMRLDMLK